MAKDKILIEKRVRIRPFYRTPYQAVEGRLLGVAVGWIPGALDIDPNQEPMTIGGFPDRFPSDGSLNPFESFEPFDIPHLRISPPPLHPVPPQNVIIREGSLPGDDYWFKRLLVRIRQMFRWFK